MEIFTRRIRFFVRLLGALVRKYYLAILFGFVLSLVLIFGLPKLVLQVQSWQQVRDLAVVGRVTQSEIPIFIQKKISFGLTTLADDNAVQPGIASSWEIKDEGKTYIFTLKNNLFWHDGSLLISKDINYNFRDVQIEYPDTKHLILKLKEPFAPLLVAVSQPIFKTGLIGIGDYRVGSIKRNGQQIDSFVLAPTKGSESKIRYHFYVSEDQARTAFKLGIVDEILEIEEAGDFIKWPNVKIISQIKVDKYVGLFMNTLLIDKNLRLALAYGTDKSEWQNRAYSPIAKNSWAYTEDAKKYDYDLNRAKQLLKKAEKIPEKITITTSNSLWGTAEKIKRDWEKMGLKAEIKVLDTVPDDYQVLLTIQNIPIDPDQYNLWHSSRTTNLTKLNNKRIDLFLELGRTKHDQNTRKQIYQDFQKYLLEETPVIFLYHPVRYTIDRN